MNPILENKEVLELIEERRKLQPFLLPYHFNIGKADYCKGILKDSATPDEVLWWLIDYGDNEDKCRVASLPRCNREMRDKLFRIENDNVLAAMAKNPTLDQDEYEILLTGSDAIKLSLAQNEKTPTEILKVLSTNLQDQTIINATLSNPNVPVEIIEKALKRKDNIFTDFWKVANLTKEVVQMCPTGSRYLLAVNPHLAEEEMEELLKNSAPYTISQLAENPSLTPKILEILIKSHINNIHGSFALNPGLTVEMQKKLAVEKKRNFQQTLATRRPLDSSIIPLLDTSVTDIVLALLENPTVKDDPAWVVTAKSSWSYSLNHIMDKINNEELAKLLVKEGRCLLAIGSNPNWSPQFIETLMGLTAVEVRQGLALNPTITTQQREELTRDPRLSVWTVAIESEFLPESVRFTSAAKRMQELRYGRSRWWREPHNPDLAKELLAYPARLSSTKSKMYHGDFYPGGDGISTLLWKNQGDNLWQMRSLDNPEITAYINLPRHVDGTLQIYLLKDKASVIASEGVSLGDGREHYMRVEAKIGPLTSRALDIRPSYSKWKGGKQLTLQALVLYRKILFAQWGIDNSPMGWTLEVEAGSVPANKRLTYRDLHKKEIMKLIGDLERTVRPTLKKGISL